MSEIKSYKDLLIWQKGIEITEKTYQLTKNFPSEEQFTLTSQMRRCAISVPSNISEGYGRNSTKSYIQFLRIARGSLFELETQLIIAKKLNYVLNKELNDSIFLLIEEESKMINSFIKKLDINNKMIV
ncbi:MAG: four helix bundle protein [Fluviicola sp.]|jgi:four helix bundle protein|nr:four helix bundle protein [Fluviicola sp.]